MSGPKLSAAEIEEMRREALERERQARIRAHKATMARFHTVMMSAGGLKSELSELKSRYVLESALMTQDEKIKICAIIDETLYTLSSFSADGFSTTEEYQKLTEDIEKVLTSAKGKKTEINNLIKKGQNNFNNVRAMRSNVQDGQVSVNDVTDVSDYKNINVSFQRDVSISQGVAVSEEEALRLRQQKNAENDQLIDAEEMQEMYHEYSALALILSISIRAFDTFSDIDELTEALEDCRDQYRQKDEMDYIADKINEVMEELGYTFVQSRVLRQNNNVNMTLFPMGDEQDCSLYKADDETGILIFTGDNGDVMMQMTNIADGPITDSDREWSYQRQIDFCAAHPEIVSALAEKGVILRQKNYREPNRMHTRKVSASNIAGMGVSKSPNRRDRRRKSAGKAERAHKE